MKLQINTSGTWRNVCEFEGHQLQHIQAAAVPLARELGERASWRITDDGLSAYSYMSAPTFAWHLAIRYRRPQQ